MHGHLPVVARSTVPPAAASAASLSAQGWPAEAEVATEAQALVPPSPTGPRASAAAAWVLLLLAAVPLLSAPLGLAGYSPRDGSAFCDKIFNQHQVASRSHDDPIHPPQGKLCRCSGSSTGLSLAW